VNRVLGRRIDRPGLVDRLADDVEDAPEGLWTDRDSDWAAKVVDRGAAPDAVCAAHGDGADRVIAEVGLRFQR
jgi:hypothetical protein